MTIRLRFVRSDSALSDAIVRDTGGLYSHVEAVTPEGLYLGAHIDGGVLARPPDYDEGHVALEKFVDLPPPFTFTPIAISGTMTMTIGADPMADKFYAYLNACIGEPYDFAAIAGFVAHLDLHQRHKVICSALQTLALRGCGWFASPLSLMAHEISPRDLFLIISGRVAVA